MKKDHLLTTEQYKAMINNNLIRDKNVTQYIVEKKKIKKNKKNLNIKEKKLDTEKMQLQESIYRIFCEKFRLYHLVLKLYIPN